ncbi:hypothetical protein J6590_084908 [Homalodisca vitripennis]|nr:hypothetical protein J6590_084908 [Homalodisca vitripennis]
MSSDNEDHLINPARSVHRQQNPLSVTQSGEVEKLLPNHSSFLKREKSKRECKSTPWYAQGDPFPSIAHGQVIRDHEHVNFDEELECEVMSEQP